MAKRDWKPQPKQRDAIECPAFELFYGGAKGGGKSDFLLADFLQGLKHGEDHRGIIFRRSYPELEELIARSKEMYFGIGDYFEGRKTWKFEGGATLKFRYVESDSDVDAYQGHQYTWIGFDELTNWSTDYCYIFMLSCARSAAGTPVFVRATGNPGRVGHAWVKKRFVDIAEPGTIYVDENTGMDRCFIPASVYDNEILMRNDPDYEQRLRMLPDHLRRAFLEGDWTIFAGQVFEEFRYESHVIKPIKIEPSWFRFASLDWGYQKPYSIGWWAVTHDGKLIRYREMYGCEADKENVGVQRTAQDVAAEAWEKSVAEGCIDMVADPSLWAKHGMKDKGEALTIADVFNNAGFRMLRANNDRKHGLQILHDYMKSIDHDNLPTLVVFSTCKAFIRTIPLLVSSERDPEDVDTTGEDHVYDEVRYAVTSSLAQTRQRPARTLDDLGGRDEEEEKYDPFAALD